MKKKEKTSRLKLTFRILQRFTWGFLIVFSLTLALYLGNRAYRKLSNSSYFQAKTISIHGNHYLSKTDITYYLGISEKTNLLAIDLRSLCQKLTSHPWIKKASVQRRLPNTLYINLQERTPIAILKAGKLYYVDREGVVFDTINKEAGCDFPLITGPNRVSEIHAYSPLIKEAISLINTKTNTLISELHLNLNRGLTLITLNEAIPVKLGFTDITSRMRRFKIIYHYLMRREIKAETIDCRYPDRIVVKYQKTPHSEGKREKVG